MLLSRMAPRRPVKRRDNQRKDTESSRTRAHHKVLNRSIDRLSLLLKRAHESLDRSDVVLDFRKHDLEQQP